ncbi:unnamed protein product [Didymodactylos carnosus]|uniref:Uncharacterized protein n=1 Tax=Didymodactylos carnosus TaxID=1234261 RepID=A0A813YX85_9BILA|nr:unnamed protein product [Didymodactylos carnosus]CAF3675270.1 unnamed protein product [Didymodactylos carnosus]
MGSESKYQLFNIISKRRYANANHLTALYSMRSSLFYLLLALMCFPDIQLPIDVRSISFTIHLRETCLTFMFLVATEALLKWIDIQFVKVVYLNRDDAKYFGVTDHESGFIISNKNSSIIQKHSWLDNIYCLLNTLHTKSILTLFYNENSSNNTVSQIKEKNRRQLTESLVTAFHKTATTPQTPNVDRTMLIDDRTQNVYETQLSKLESDHNDARLSRHTSPVKDMDIDYNLDDIKHFRYQQAESPTTEFPRQTDGSNNSGQNRLIWRPYDCLQVGLIQKRQYMRMWLTFRLFEQLINKINTFNYLLEQTGCDMFIGVNPINDIKCVLSTQTDELKRLTPYLDWTHEQNYVVRRMRGIN